VDSHLSELDTSNFKTMIQRVVEEFPNMKIVATTLRNAKTACLNDWGAIIWAGGQFYEARHRENLEILDRVGGGDGFVSGLAYAFLEGKSPQEAVEWGATHGALAMTTPGDTSMVSRQEVEQAMAAKGARVVR
jgi:2-dehydro-3-deoxygluconokinase